MFYTYEKRMKKEIAIIYYLADLIPNLWQTMLYKLLFYIDFSYFRDNEVSLTWATYYKLPFWPVPLSIKSNIDIMISQESNIDIEDRDFSGSDFEYYNNYLKVTETNSWEHKKWIVSKNHELNIEEYLKPDEIVHINTILERIKRKISEIKKKNINFDEINTKDIVELSHEEPAYKHASMYQPLFYGFADSLLV